MLTFSNRPTLLCAFIAATAHAQAITVPLTPSAWIASDTIRAETHLGRPSIYIDRGAAIVGDADFRDGTIELDMAATARTNFMGISFHATTTDNSEVVFFRVNGSGTAEAVQYGPALNGHGAAWQVYHGDGANAVASLAREQWIHVKIEVAGSVAKIFLNDSTVPILTVPHLAGVAGRRFGVWTGNFGRGAYFSNLRYTRAAAPTAEAAVELRAGTIRDWQISDAFDAATLAPGTLPNLSPIKWESVHAETPGMVLINRYRRAPIASIPVDKATGLPLSDSIMTGKVAGSKVVLARTVLQSDRDQFTRMHFGYSDGVVVYCNGTPLFFGMRAQSFREPSRDLGVMDREGDAVYLPLKKGGNEIVFAVTEYSGGWAFWARLDR